MLNWLLNKLLDRLTRALLPSTTVKGVLALNKQLRLYEDGAVMSPQALHSLKEEVKFLEQSIIWKHLNANLVRNAQIIMFEKSESLIDLRIGKTMLYTLDTQKKILENIKKSI